MSTAVVSTSAALGRPFVFDDNPAPEASCHSEQSGKCTKRIPRGVEESLPLPDPRLATVTSASRLAIRPAPEMAFSGIPALDALTGGLPRGCLTEICGPTSSGRTTVLLAALAAATRRGEFCALVDASDALDPDSAVSAGVELEKLLWVRCDEISPQKALSPQSHRDTEKTFFEINSVSEDREYQSLHAFSIKNQKSKIKTTPDRQSEIGNRKFSRSGSEHRLEQVLRATDLLLESGGFGLIVLDLADLSPQDARRIPLTTWFRFRRAVEYKPTILLAIEQQAIAGSCSSLLLRLEVPSAQYPVPSSNPSHTQLLAEMQIRAELIRSRLDRKPVCSTAAFSSKTAWAG